jgi:hypothetical protein
LRREPCRATHLRGPRKQAGVSNVVPPNLDRQWRYDNRGTPSGAKAAACGTAPRKSRPERACGNRTAAGAGRRGVGCARGGWSAKTSDKPYKALKESGRQAGRPQNYFRGGSVTGTCGEELTILVLPSAWVWLRINDSKIRKNFSASMAQPRCCHL